MSDLRINKSNRDKREPNSKEVWFGGYRLTTEDGELTVWGCDCCAVVDTVEQAKEMVRIINDWIEDQSERS